MARNNKKGIGETKIVKKKCVFFGIKLVSVFEQLSEHGNFVSSAWRQRHYSVNFEIISEVCMVVDNWYMQYLPSFVIFYPNFFTRSIIIELNDYFS